MMSFFLIPSKNIFHSVCKSVSVKCLDGRFSSFSDEKVLSCWSSFFVKFSKILNFEADFCACKGAEVFSIFTSVSFISGLF